MSERAVTALRKRCATLQKLTNAVFYLFGGVLFVGFQWAYVTAATSHEKGEWFVLENFVVYFAFAANVFFVFLIIHCVQWFVSSKVDERISHFDVPTVS
jgi:di/tricarboxylate transporter